MWSLLPECKSTQHCQLLKQSDTEAVNWYLKAAEQGHARAQYNLGWKYENGQGKVDIEDSKGKAALETLIEIIAQHPKFWKGKADTIINIVNEISKGKIFQNQIRECALELVYSLAKSSASAIKKSANFKNIFIPLLFNLMLEIDNENDDMKWEKNYEEKAEDRDEMFYAVRD